MHLEPFGLSVHAFGWTGQENIIPTCRSAGNYYIHSNRIDIEYPIGDQHTTGIANPKGACDDYRRCAVVEDTGPNMGLSLAHEIGHL